MISRFLIGLWALLTLAACAAPLEPVSIRAGLGSDADLDQLRPPSGVTYRFEMIDTAFPVPTEMRLTAKRRARDAYSYDGEMVITLPRAQNLGAVAQTLARQLGRTSVRAKGNQIFIPVALRTDQRFRSTSSSFLSDTINYMPHDCFGMIGTCRHKAQGAEGSAELISETTEKDGVWQVKTRLDPRKPNKGVRPGTRSSIYSMDRNGVLIDMVIMQNQGSDRSRLIFRRK